MTSLMSSHVRLIREQHPYRRSEGHGTCRILMRKLPFLRRLHAAPKNSLCLFFIYSNLPATRWSI